MTSSIVIDTQAALAEQQALHPAGGGRTVTPRVNAHLSFGGVLRSERIKLSSLRSIRLTLGLTVLMGLGMSAMIALVWRDNLATNGVGVVAATAVDLQNYLLASATFPAPFLALIFGVLGVFAISSEYNSGMILSTLAAVPRRSPVFAAKALVLAAVSALTALVLVAGGVGFAVALYPAAASEALSLAVVSGTLGTVGFLVLIALFAFGVAGVLRSTAGGIAVVSGVTFVLPIALQMLGMTGWAWVQTALNLTPMVLSSTLSAGIVDTSGMDGLSYWPALAAMAVWAAVTVVPAALLFKSRDAK